MSFVLNVVNRGFVVNEQKRNGLLTKGAGLAKRAFVCVCVLLFSDMAEITARWYVR